MVRPHQELVFISQEGMVQRTNVRGIRATGRAAQGVTLMNVREEDHVSAVALVVESDGSTAAVVSDEALADGPLDLSADSGDTLPDGVVDEDVPEGADGAVPTAGPEASEEGPEEGGDGVGIRRTRC